LVVSNHHSRELITPQIALDTAERLLTQYSTNSTVKNLIDNNQIYLMWTVNPDGLDYVWKSNNMWRKNRKRKS
jgi:murein tripeptide amidase MpaA